jgi:hypothetical protein
MAFCLKVQQNFISAHVDILFLNKAEVQRVATGTFTDHLLHTPWGAKPTSTFSA